MVRNRLLLVLMVFFAAPCLVAQEQPENDPLAIISNRPRPNVLLLVDTSGSMLWDTRIVNGRAITVRRENQDGTSSELRSPSTSYNREHMNHFFLDADNPKSRMGQAKSAMREIMSQIQDVNLGLGRFKRALKLNRFRTYVPSGLDQVANQDSGYTYYYWDNQTPQTGTINIPYRRYNPAISTYEYPFAKTVRREWSSYWSWDALSMEWSTSSSNTQYIGGDHHTRMNWWYDKVENARRQMFRALTDDGWYVYRDSHSSPDERHPNKLNQVDNIDIFLSDEEFITLKQNTDLEETLSVQRYVESAYGVTIGQTLTFTYNPVIADYDTSTSCADGQVLIDIQNRFEDDPDTLVDESDNRDELIAMTGPIHSNARVYDFEVNPPEMLNTGPFFSVANTPLGTTLLTARDYFASTIASRDQANAVDHCRENFIILLTDGIETCNSNPESVAQDIYNNYGIKVFVIAFVTNTSQADAIAYAGGTDQAFTADNKDELVEALQNIFNEIRTSVELSAPIAATTGEAAGEYIEGDTVLQPFFDFPGFNGRLQALKLFKMAVVEIDTKTGAIVTDLNGDPVIIEDDITEDRVLELINDPDDPIDKDPAREIVGLQLSTPDFKWEAGELLSLEHIEDDEAQYVYDYLKPDSSDLDNDGSTSELTFNPAYKEADSRRVLTVLGTTQDAMTVVNFDEATMIDTDGNRDAAKALLGVTSWTDDEARFLVNFARGKQVRRFTEATTLYGQTFQAGDPMPDPSSDDNDGDGVPDGFLYVEREWKKGDIISSTPVVVRPPGGTFPIAINDNNNSLHDYDEFIEAHAGTPQLVVVGSNDGMLHAYALSGIDLNDDGDFDDANEYYPGEEVWAFVIPTSMNKLQNLFADSPEDDDIQPDGQRLDPHQYFVDGQITLSIVRARVHTGDTDGDGKSNDPEFRSMMFFGEGRGGSYYWAFDMTDPMNPQPVWTLSDLYMGQALSRPAVGPLEVAGGTELDNDQFKYYAFMGSGPDYSQVDGSASVGNVFYKVDIDTGLVVDSFSAGDQSGGANIPNAIVSRGILVDEDDDFFIERAYCADLDGNIWRWNLSTGSVTNILNVASNPLTTQAWRLERPITDSITYGNIFGFHIITAATGGDTRMYLADDDSRKTYPKQTIYLIVDTDKQGNVVSLLNGEFDDEGNYTENSDTVGIDLPDNMLAENQPVITSFTEYDEEGKIFRGFQTFYPTYTPDPAGLRSIRCSFGHSDLLILDSIFSESDIVSSTTGALINMGEGKATGISYTGGNILFAIGDEFKVYGTGVYRFESTQRVKARLKVLSWKEVF